MFALCKSSFIFRQLVVFRPANLIVNSAPEFCAHFRDTIYENFPSTTIMTKFGAIPPMRITNSFRILNFATLTNHFSFCSFKLKYVASPRITLTGTPVRSFICRYGRGISACKRKFCWKIRKLERVPQVA